MICKNCKQRGHARKNCPDLLIKQLWKKSLLNQNSKENEEKISEEFPNSDSPPTHTRKVKQWIDELEKTQKEVKRLRAVYVNFLGKYIFRITSVRSERYWWIGLEAINGNLDNLTTLADARIQGH